ncbi:uncharacterized protein LOC141665700 [Apium graveolens]|uniref:uncharacterized protein LOC141665700 n=1 Tax=Apium graveolens TaxID=4045 RepID=UPI003D7ACA40
METEYPETINTYFALAYVEDSNGIGKQFIARTTQRQFLKGEIDVPKAFVKFFHHMLKLKNYIILTNEEKFKVSFSATRSEIYGLRGLRKTRFWKVGDTLIFELTAPTEFRVTILSNKGVAKNIPRRIVRNVNQLSEDNDDNLRSFEVVLIRSNVDKNIMECTSRNGFALTSIAGGH